MSTLSVYFIPVNKITTGNFKRLAVEILEEMGVINGHYDEAGEGFASGEVLLFEYATIYDGPVKRLVPEAAAYGLGAVCAHCDESIDDVFCKTISTFYDQWPDTRADMDRLQLTCTNCNSSMTLSALKYCDTVAFETQFFQFVHVGEEVSESFVYMLQQRFGTRFQVIYERS